MHFGVGRVERRFVEMKRVAVLHQELARAHHAEAGPDLVAELQVDLIEVAGQLLVALHFAANDVGDDLFVRGAETEVALVAILQSQHFGSHLVPALRLLPQLCRLYERHQYFLRTAAVHLFADDRFDLAQHAQAERQPGIDPRGESADEAGAQHEAMARNVGVGRRLFESGNQQLTRAHVLYGS